MYTRILVPLDGSKLAEQVLPYVRLLAGAYKIPIGLLNVFEPVPPGFADPGHGLFESQITGSFHDQAIDYLGGVVTTLKDTGVTISCAAHEGNPADQIINEAQKTPNTLIAMVTHGRSGVGRWVLGSVTDKVLHATSDPLLITRAREEDTASSVVSLKNIVVPLDGSPLAEQVLPHVEPLAKALGLNVVLVRVSPSSQEYYRYMDQQMVVTVNTSRIEEYAKEADNEATGYLLQVKERLTQGGVSSVDQRLVHGNPANAILDTLEDIPDSLVALTTHGRSGVGRWVLGSITDRLVRHSGHPVLVVRSKD